MSTTDDEPLPPYRYGLEPGPHPTRDPGGHARGAPERRRTLGESVSRGLHLFARRYFWEAHEVWEDSWRELPLRDPRREFLQGLIQVTAAEWKRARGQAAAARGLAIKAERRLRLGMEGHGDVALGIDGAAVLETLAAADWDAAERGPLPLVERCLREPGVRSDLPSSPRGDGDDDLA